MLSSALSNSSVSHGVQACRKGNDGPVLDIKEQHPDTFSSSNGDFYELFHEDAEVAAEVLGLSLTSRDKTQNNPSPWRLSLARPRGPSAHHARAGYKVTVAEQKRIEAWRQIVGTGEPGVYTLGAYEEGLLEGDEQSLLAAVVLGSDAQGLAVLDASTVKHGPVLTRDRAFHPAQDDLLRWQPSELVISPKDAENDHLAPLFPD